MDQLIGEIWSFFRQTTEKRLYVTNRVFYCHYRISFLLFWLLMCALYAYSSFGSNKYITCDCVTTSSKFVNNYCYLNSLYNVFSKNLSRDAASLNCSGTDWLECRGIKTFRHDEDYIVHHPHYKWLPYYIFIQFISFYVPYEIFKWLIADERSTIEKCASTNEYVNIVFTYKWLQGTEQSCSLGNLILNLANRFRAVDRFQINSHWALKMFFCELLNMVNVIGQFFFINNIMKGQFVYFGWQYTEIEVLSTLFPKMVKCMFFTYGKSGERQTHDTLCALPLNSLYEKFYIVLWFWLVILITLSVLAIVWRIISFLLYRNIHFNKLYYQHVLSKEDKDDLVVKILSGQRTYNNWLTLCYLSDNVDPSIFLAIIENVYNHTIPEKKTIATLPHNYKILDDTQSDITTSEESIKIKIRKRYENVIGKGKDSDSGNHSESPNSISNNSKYNVNNDNYRGIKRRPSYYEGVQNEYYSKNIKFD